MDVRGFFRRLLVTRTGRSGPVSSSQDGRPDPITAAQAYGIDITLVAANLRRTPAERVRQLDAMYDFAHRVKRIPA
jgi:hypothetical protein